MKSMAWMAAALAVAGLTTGCNNNRNAAADQRVATLEQRVTSLEQRTEKLESEEKRIADLESNRTGLLQGCLSGADATYENNVMQNGKKGKDGAYVIPAPLLEQMQKQKQDKIAECKTLYSK